MSIQGTLTEDDYVRALSLSMRPRRAFAIVGVVLLALSVPAVATMLWHRFWIGVTPFVMLPLLFGYLRWNARRHFRSFKALSEHSVITLQDDGLFFKKESSQALVKWTDLLKWREGRDLLLLYPAPWISYAVPRHFFSAPETFEDFCALLKTKLGEQR